MRKNEDKGQAVLEYVLMTLIAVSFVMVIASTFRRTIVKVWGYYTNQIVAACPGCPVDPAYRFR
ncbi:MAG: hypothetical protein HYX41_02265 [Bdellovibrio sp.]|nr:hypothetical protein [Bdellovibrio sp.]